MNMQDHHAGNNLAAWNYSSVVLRWIQTQYKNQFFGQLS